MSGTADDEARAEVGRLVLRFISGVVLHSQQVSQRLGLGPSDAQFMNLLRLHGPLSPRALADLTGLTSGSVTGVLNRLEELGYVRREHDTRDRRRVLVTPVPEALDRLAQQYREHSDRMRQVLQTRDGDQLRVVRDFLADLAPADPPTPPTG